MINNVKQLVKHTRRAYALLRAREKAVADTFKWRDRKGVFHRPSDMHTHHLFYTVRMIWNHNMPVKIGTYQQYDFNGIYTDEYLKEALRAMVPELASRDDIEDSCHADLRTMTRWLSTVQLEERKKTK